MENLFIVIEDVIEVKPPSLITAPFKLLMCEINEGCNKIPLLITGIEIIFTKNTLLPSRHKLSNIPIALWNDVSYIAS